MLSYYKELLGYPNAELFLNKYLADSALQRLKGVGYFCGMDYASKNIYNFSEYISRYDHSLTVALLIYKLTRNKRMTIAGLYHDIATPCFSHVIDYMNKDYIEQSSTESHTEEILKRDYFLQERLKEDSINLEDIIDYKKFSVVDNERPKLCADRLDAIILNSIGWLKNISEEDIKRIIDDLIILKNEHGESEIGFSQEIIAKKALQFNDAINRCMHSDEDIYMMQLLADIVNYCITNGHISESCLYLLSEEQIFEILKSVDDDYLKGKIREFTNIKKEDIPQNLGIVVKNRNLKPLTRSRRIDTI